ncbi:MAG: malate synthase [Rhodopirellula sp. JB053]|uniref:malate synthase n=1 Tax=Rhodopirellula sp. JB044 TaxID=3342844 RepID=UPI00370ABFDA
MKKRFHLSKPTPFWVGAFVVTCCSLSTATAVQAQGLDDLFATPADNQYQFSDAPVADQPASDQYAEPTGYLSRPKAIPASTRTSEAPMPMNDAHAAPSPSDLRLENTSGSHMIPRKPTAMELRQARALEETRARMARLEAARWGLRPTLRPAWAADPMTSSRYPSGGRYVVPFYMLVR